MADNVIHPNTYGNSSPQSGTMNPIDNANLASYFASSTGTGVKLPDNMSLDQMASIMNNPDYSDAYKSWLGSIYDNIVNERIYEDTKQYNTEMANTQYQRAVRDLQAAGLNPALAYSQGGNSYTGASGYSSSTSASGYSQSGQQAAGFASTILGSIMTVFGLIIGKEFFSGSSSGATGYSNVGWSR